MTYEALECERTPVAELEPAKVRAQLEKIVTSPGFSESPRLQQFLTYVIEEALANRAERIKGYSIAHDVFQRDDPEDAQVSGIVRVEAGRLRRRLDDYYASNGEQDSLRISIPKGAYVPLFERLQPPSSQADRLEPELQPASDASNARRLRLGALGLLVTAGLIWWILEPASPVGGSERPTATATEVHPFIAVLPFSQTADVREADMAAGLTEDIVTDLTRLPSIDVLALSTARHLIGDTVDVSRLRDDFGITHALMGNVRGTADRLRVSAWLIDTTSGREIWAERFDRELTDMLALQDELAVKVVEGMGATLSESRRRGFYSRATNPETLSLYKQAMDLGNPPSEPVRNALALESFRHLIQIAPGFAGGYAGAAYMHAFAALFAHSQNTEQDVADAIDLAETAIELAPDYGMSYTALAFAYLVQRDFDQALAYSSAAVEAEPNDPYVMTYHGVLLAFNGDAEAGVPYAERAIRLDPLNARTPYLNILGTILLHAGRFEEAEVAFSRNLVRGGPDTPGNRISHAAALYHQGRHEEAWSMLDQIEDFPAGRASAMRWTLRTRRLEADVELLSLPLRSYDARMTTGPS